MLERIRYMFEGFRNETSHWQFLNLFFKPTVTRFFVSWFALAPVFVRVVEKLPDPLVIPTSSTFVSISLGLPFSWELLWWASLIYAIAFVMDLIICPGFVKRYPDYNTYTDRGHSPRWLVWEVYRASKSISVSAREKLFDRLISKKYAFPIVSGKLDNSDPTVTLDGTEWIFEFNGAAHLISIDEELSQTRQKDLFWEILARYGGSRALARYIIWLMLAAASFFVFLVVIQNVLFVLNYLFK